MACPDTDAIVDFVDGEPAPEERGRVEAHLAGCATCRELVAAMARGDGPRPDDRPPTIGRFVIADVLGRGGMGVVYRAHDPELGRDVAIKLVRRDPTAPDPDARDRLAREARALARLSHPNVVAVYDVGEHDGAIYLAMELVSGDTLRGWLEAAPRDRDRILDVLLDAGAGLAAAHQAGLVHRDVKPENIVIGDDGRARVLDFGLVGAVRGARPPAGGDVALTRTGMLLGTPAYMAPEQLDGRPVDARTDQFGFSATACEALCGRRPVAGRTPEDVADALARGEIRVPEAIAPRLRAALARGLAADPEERFPSMDALLAALAAARRPPPWRRGVLAAAAALAIGGATALLTGWLGASDPEPCRGADAALAGAWDAEVAATVGGAIAASGHPDAAGARARVLGALDDYAARWTTMRTAACRATRVERSQSEAVLDQRMRCLDLRLARLRGLATALRGPLDAAAVDTALAVSLALPPLEPCADLDALARATPLPTDPARRAAFLELEARVAASDPLRDLGRLDDARDAAAALVEEARALDHPAIEAQARIGLGRTLMATGAAREALPHLREAVRLAARAGDDRTAAEAWIRWIETLRKLDDFKGALALVDAAEAAVLRAGDPADLAVHLDLEVGGVHWWLGDYPAVHERFDRALARVETAVRPDEILLAHVLVWRASFLEELGRGEEAVAAATRGLAIFRDRYGNDHPLIGWPTAMLGNAYEAAGRHDEALVTLEAAVALFQRYNESSSTLEEVYRNLGRIHRRRGDLDAAIDSFRRALAISQKNSGPDSYRASIAEGNLAVMSLAAGRVDEAEAMLKRVGDVRRRVMGEDHFSLGWNWYHLGRAARLRGDRATAIERFEEALPLLESGPPEETAGHLGWTRLYLAQLLWEDPRQRARALALAAAAVEPFTVDEDAEGLAELAAWRAAHR